MQALQQTQEVRDEPKVFNQCQATTRSGNQCKATPTRENGMFCNQHIPKGP